MPPWAVHPDPIPGTCSYLCRQNCRNLCQKIALHSRPSRLQSVSHPPETLCAHPGQPRRPLPAGRRTHMSLSRNSDAGLASASPRSLVHCLRAASSSWTLLRPLFATGLPGTALSCSYLVSLCARLPWAPAPLEPRWMLHVVEAAQPPPSSLWRSSFLAIILEIIYTLNYSIIIKFFQVNSWIMIFKFLGNIMNIIEITNYAHYGNRLIKSLHQLTHNVPKRRRLHRKLWRTEYPASLTKQSKMTYFYKSGKIPRWQRVEMIDRWWIFPVCCDHEPSGLDSRYSTCWGMIRACSKPLIIPP